MAELTIIINHWGHKELKDYLMSLKGIKKIIIKNEEQLEIYIKYDPNLISMKIIKIEILLFLNILKVPSILSFDKHSTGKSLNYEIIKKDICCEYCFMGAIEDLFEIDGVEKVESNFKEGTYYQKDYDELVNVIISIKYNPNLISIEKMKQIESDLNL